jgi:hypothetical protein
LHTDSPEHSVEKQSQRIGEHDGLEIANPVCRDSDPVTEGGARMVGGAVSDPTKEALSGAVEEVLAPLAQLAMEMQVGAGEFIRLIERAFIRAVEEDSALAGRPKPGASAVAARSGLTRQRVSQLRSMTTGETPRASGRQPQTLRILSAWKTDPKFCDRSGLPKILPVRGPVSFSALVQRHGSGLRARSILKELERIKAVRLTKERQVELLHRADVSAARKAQMIRDLGEFGREFLETLSHNVLNPETPRYHRRVVALHVKNEEIPRLTRDATSQAGVWALALQDAITDNSVTVKPGPGAQRATRLSGHFFLSERPSIVRPKVMPRSKHRPSSLKGRQN